ncbi:MAG: hypothetical protein ACRDRR_12395 [Pseudonocardiaceae bacterium]
MTSDPMRDLRKATAELNDATGQFVERIIDENQALTEWVTAVAHHALMVEAAVRDLETRVSDRRA